MRIKILISLFLTVGSFAVAQSVNTTDADVSSTLARMKSQNWTDRDKAFGESVRLLASRNLAPDDADRLRLGIIDLLSTENSENRVLETDEAAAAVPESDDTDSEEVSEYYASLIDYVAQLGDERAIPALLGATHTGYMAVRGVARFGYKALDPTLEQVKSKDPHLASGALLVIQQLLEWHTIRDPNSKLRIKRALRTALQSPDSIVRKVAIYAIEYLDDREEFVPMLKDIAEHDPYKLQGLSLRDGTVGDIYFVREAAAELLRKIANHTPPVVDRGVND